MNHKIIFLLTILEELDDDTHLRLAGPGAAAGRGRELVGVLRKALAAG
jgi:hypothetical protein